MDEVPAEYRQQKGPGADFRDVFRRAELDKLGPEKTAIDDQGHHWWYIELGAKDGSIRQGWVCEENPPLVRMCGPWDWPGFDLVDNSSFKPVDMLKRYIYASEQFLVGEEQSEFEQSALTVNAGGLITQLEKAIDANHDGKVTAQELQHAQETPWTAEALSHLVVRSETEWGGGLGKWEELSPLMKKLLWLWQAEMERIGKLQWWEQAAGIEGFPKEPNPWHFHPVGVVGNFSNGEVIDGLIAWGKKVSVEFKQKVIVISRDLGLDPSYLMSAMAFETGETFRADIRNAAGSGATGLIQFMPNTAINLGTTTTQLARMSNVDQLDYVKKYFLPKQGRLHTLEDVYCMIFYPQAIGKPDNYIIAHKKKVNSHGVQVDDPIYMQNAGFDAENVGYITKYQISGRLREKYSKGMSVGYIG